MDKNITIIKVGGLVSSSSIMTNMVIFNDPVYIYLAFGGGIVSMGGLIHEVVEHEILKDIKKIFGEVIRALLFGFILTPMLFMFYINAGDKFLNAIFLNLFNIDISGISAMLNSFWFLGAIFTSWYILPIWSSVLQRFKRRKKDDK